MRTPCRRSRINVGVDTLLGVGATQTSAEHVVARDRVDTGKIARQHQLLHRTKPVPIPEAARELGR